jgi:hypothetical protein
MLTIKFMLILWKLYLFLKFPGLYLRSQILRFERKNITKNNRFIY